MSYLGKPQQRWIVEVRNGKNREVVSERYYDREDLAMAAYWRAKFRHRDHPLLEIRVWQTDNIRLRQPQP